MPASKVYLPRAQQRMLNELMKALQESWALSGIPVLHYCTLCALYFLRPARCRVV